MMLTVSSACKSYYHLLPKQQTAKSYSQYYTKNRNCWRAL